MFVRLSKNDSQMDLGFILHLLANEEPIQPKGENDEAASKPSM
jgi:hypothetical protein